MNKIYEHYGDRKEVAGYELNGWYLMKKYYYGNSYNWIINKTGESHYFTSEFMKAVESNEVIICESFKDGKAKLLELAS